MRRQHRPLSGGWLLVSLIVLISAVILTLVGVTFFLTEHLRVTSLRQNQTKALYLAHAGVMRAIYDFRFDGPGAADGNFMVPGIIYDAIPGDSGAPGLADDDVFVLGGQAADFLLAAMNPATWATPGAPAGCGPGSRHRLQNWTLRNASNTTIRFNQMVVSWSPDAGEKLIRVDLGSTAQDWPTSGCGSVSSGMPITLNSVQTLTLGDFWGTNRMWFTTTSMDGKAWIEVVFLMIGGSTRRVRVIPIPGSSSVSTASSANFTIDSIGEARSSSFPFVARRRVRAEYRLGDTDNNVANDLGRITSDTALLLDQAASVDQQRPGYKEINP